MTLTVVKTTALTGTITNAQLAGGIDLTAKVTGTLPIANGGTNSTATTFVNATTNVTGALPIVNGGTGATSFSPGKIAQVISGGTSSSTSTSSSSFVNSNCTVAITPTASNSKVLLQFSGNGIFVTAQATAMAFQLVRTVGGVSTNLSTKFARYVGYMTTLAALNDMQEACSFEFLDSPSTTSATTYTIQIQRETGSGSVTLCANGQASSFVAMEVLA